MNEVPGFEQSTIDVYSCEQVLRCLTYTKLAQGFLETIQISNCISASKARI